jgi:hypothetical protein
LETAIIMETRIILSLSEISSGIKNTVPFSSYQMKQLVSRRV